MPIDDATPACPGTLRSRARPWRIASAAAFAIALSACGERAQLLANEDSGATPKIVAPEQRLIPTIDIAPAVGWSASSLPVAADGWKVTAFARDLSHPRWLHVLPNGDVLVAESNAPPGKSGIRGLRGAIMGSVMKRAGAGVSSADRITLLRDADGDGRAETRSVLLDGLHSPFGMALVEDTLYIANADALVRVPYAVGDTRIDAAPVKLFDLPGKGDDLNHHWTKSLLASADGSRLYIGVGSNSNVGENGMAAEAGRASIWEFDLRSGKGRVFASGLRNPVGLAWQPASGALWTVVNERDELGSDLVPDYLTEVREGAFYGWPYRYYGRPDPRAPAPPQGGAPPPAILPDFALGSHVAPLGLAFDASGAYIGLHGSWNRTPLNGYKVVFVPFSAGRPQGAMQDILTGFVDDAGNARGRPAGVAIDARGGVLVADDVGNAVWRVSAMPR
ncbi:sorbosone dehydrogenase family protein [Lysobacter hankyongensis]|uniref:Sorbosone dehydrogenase family protein n=2 Tax=Lysobacter hankyongensis TaxID=1176535 RepID=A0ABP9BTT9_9GAMM